MQLAAVSAAGINLNHLEAFLIDAYIYGATPNCNLRGIIENATR